MFRTFKPKHGSEEHCEKGNKPSILFIYLLVNCFGSVSVSRQLCTNPPSINQQQSADSKLGLMLG